MHACIFVYEGDDVDNDFCRLYKIGLFGLNDHEYRFYGTEYRTHKRPYNIRENSFCVHSKSRIHTHAHACAITYTHNIHA